MADREEEAGQAKKRRGRRAEIIKRKKRGSGKRAAAVKAAIKTAQAELSHSKLRGGASVALEYADNLKDDVSLEMLHPDESFLFLVDTETGQGLLCEYNSNSTQLYTSGHYKQVHLSREDVRLLKKSTGIVPNYFDLRQDMLDRPELITDNLATLILLKVLNMFDRVNADPAEQRDMLERFIEDRTGRSVSVKTPNAPRPAAQGKGGAFTNEAMRELFPFGTDVRFTAEKIEELLREKAELEKTQSTPEERRFNALFAQTLEYAASGEYEFAIGVLKSDTYLYTWENRNSYLPEFFATKGTTFKKGTVVLRSFAQGKHDRVVVIDARDYDDIIDGTQETGAGLAEQRNRLDSEKVRYAVNQEDVDYVDDATDVRTRFKLLSRMLGDNTRSFDRWESLLEDANTVEENAKTAAKVEDAAQQLLIEGKKKLRAEFEAVKEGEITKLNALAERVKKFENVWIGRMDRTFIWSEGERSVKKNTLVLVVGKEVRSDYVDDTLNTGRFDFIAANPHKKVGERTWYSTFFLDRRKEQISDAFAAYYGKLTVPYAVGKIEPQKTSQEDLEDAQTTVSKIASTYLSRGDDEDYDATAERGQFASLKDLESQEFVSDFVTSTEKDRAGDDPLRVLKMNPAAFKKYVGVMSTEERFKYGGGENEYFAGYMNGIDFATFVLDKIEAEEALKKTVQVLNKRRAATLRAQREKEENTNSAAAAAARRAMLYWRRRRICGGSGGWCMSVKATPVAVPRDTGNDFEVKHNLGK